MVELVSTEPILITIQSISAEKTPDPSRTLTNFAPPIGIYRFENFVDVKYNLDWYYTFAEDYWARLIWVYPEPAKPCWITSHFVSSQSFNLKHQKPILGVCGGGEKVFPWVRISARSLCRTGLFRIHAVNPDESTPHIDNIIIQLQLAPTSWLKQGGNFEKHS